MTDTQFEKLMELGEAIYDQLCAIEKLLEARPSAAQVAGVNVTGVRGGWRLAKVPIGKNAGKALGALHDNGKWYVENFASNPRFADDEFTKALEEAAKEMGWTRPPPKGANGPAAGGEGAARRGPPPRVGASAPAATPARQDDLPLDKDLEEDVPF